MTYIYEVLSWYHIISEWAFTIIYIWHVFYSYLPTKQVMLNKHISYTIFDLCFLWSSSFRYFPFRRQVESQLRQDSVEINKASGIALQI